MPKHLPGLIDPLHCVAKGRRWQGRLSLAKMGRLARMISNLGDEVEVDLRFEREGRVAAITGSVRGELEVTCQRCLKPLRIAVDNPVRLGVVTSIEEGNRLPETYEPLLLEQGQVPFADIVEDELILAIPPVPKHGRCSPAKTRSEDPDFGTVAEQPSPFAVLARLKTRD